MNGLVNSVPDIEDAAATFPSAEHMIREDRDR